MAPSDVAKAKRYASLFPNEFQVTGGRLWCSFCNVKVSSKKKSQVDAHRRTGKHKRLMPPMPSISSATVSRDAITKDNFPRRVSEAFLAADIPLKKLQNPKLKQLFEDLGHPLPSETTCRGKVDEIAKDVRCKIREVIEDEETTGIFVVFDETNIRSNSYASVLLGTVDQPETTYLAHTEILENPINAQKAGTIIDNVLRSYKLPTQKVLLLISDAAKYMIKAGKNLNLFYTRMTHITCISHLFHNAAIKIKEAFPKVDKIVATVKAATVKNKTRKGLFRSAGLQLPPQPVLTRWASWLNAAMYYAKNLNQVRNIFEQMDDGGVLVNRAKKALNCPIVEEHLFDITTNYCSISRITEEETGINLTVEKSKELISNLDFGNDPCNLISYIKERIKKNGISKLYDCSDTTIEPFVYAKLYHCQSTSISVERCFSILNKLLAKDRNFKPENIDNYLVCKYNSFLI